MTNEISFLRIQSVQSRTGLARSTIYKMMSTGDFPKPVKPTPKASAWVDSEVNAWMISRMEDRESVH